MSELTLQAARRIDPKRVALALAAIWSIFAVVGIVVDQGHGTWTLQAFSLADSDLDHRLSMPASFTALLLLVAAGLAFALSRVDRTRRELQWRLAGFALLAFGVEELLGVHSWLETRGISWGVSYLPLIVAGTAALLPALRIFRNQQFVQGLYGGAILMWLAAGVLDNPTLVASNTAPELIEMAAAALFALVLLERLRYLARQYYPLEEADTRLSLDQIAAETLNRIPFRPIAIGLVLLTAAFAIQDVFLHNGNYHGHRVPILDVNTEQTLWATFQGALIMVVGMLAILTARLRTTRSAASGWWLVLGAVLIVLGTDEIVAIHDRFQEATGYAGQIVLIPVALAGVVAWWKVVNDIRDDGLTRNLLFTGAILWLVSQGIDVFVQDAHRWTVVPEEVFETLGSTCWLFALGYWLRKALPVGLIPPEPTAGQLNGHATIKPTVKRGQRTQATTG